MASPAYNFEARGPLGIINVHQDFFRTFVAEGGNMEEHIRKLHSLQKQLHALGNLIEDHNFCNVLLTSLPGSWSTFLTAINASLPTLSSDVLITQVLEEDQTRQSTHGTDTALRAQDKHGKGHNGCNDGGATKGKCNNCGKKGHWVKDCWAEGGGKEGQAPKWWKGDSTKNSTESTESTKQATENRSLADDFAFTVLESVDPELDNHSFAEDLSCHANISTSGWLVDTGSMTHIAQNRDHFIEFKAAPSEIDGITLGSLLKTLGHGTIQMEFRTSNHTSMVRLMGVKHTPDVPNNILSVGHLTDMEHVALFTNEGVKFQSQNRMIFAEGCKVGHIYIMHAWICPTIQMEMPMRGAVPGLWANLGLVTTACMRGSSFCQQWRL